jgi:polyhydroxyalkanoate synthase
LILLTAPLDFTDKTAGGFTRWVNSEAFNADRIVDTFGNVPGKMIDYGAKTLKPVENFIGSYMSLWDRIEDPKVVEAWHAMNTWVRDIIDMTGGAYRQLINEFYKENRLKEGTLVLRGERVDLKKLTADVLNVIAEADHITPPCQSEGIMDLLGSQNKEIFRVRGGHIGIMAGSGAEKTTWPHIDEWLGKRSE